MPIAIETEKAKDQHYELPTTFFKLVLGRNLKYRFVPCFMHNSTKFTTLGNYCIILTGHLNSYYFFKKNDIINQYDVCHSTNMQIQIQSEVLFFFLLTLNFLIFFYLYQLKLNLHVYEVIYHILILLSLVRKRENGY